MASGFRMKSPNISTAGRLAWEKSLSDIIEPALINSRSEQNGRPIGNGSNNSQPT